MLSLADRALNFIKRTWTIDEYEAETALVIRDFRTKGIHNHATHKADLMVMRKRAAGCGSYVSLGRTVEV